MPPAFTPQQFRTAQATLGLSDEAFAAVLGCSAQHVRRMKVEDASLPSHRPVNGATARLLQAYLDGFRSADWPV